MVMRMRWVMKWMGGMTIRGRVVRRVRLDGASVTECVVAVSAETVLV